MQLQETYRQATEDKKHAATGDLQAGDRRQRNMQLQVTKKADDRRQETCSYRRPTGRRQKTRNMQLQETYRQATEDKKYAATGNLQVGDRRQETCSYKRPTDRR
jgi:hypothetical protein